MNTVSINLFFLALSPTTQFENRTPGATGLDKNTQNEDFLFNTAFPHY